MTESEIDRRNFELGQQATKTAIILNAGAAAALFAFATQLWGVDRSTAIDAILLLILFTGGLIFAGLGFAAACGYLYFAKRSSPGSKLATAVSGALTLACPGTGYVLFVLGAWYTGRNILLW